MESKEVKKRQQLASLTNAFRTAYPYGRLTVSVCHPNTPLSVHRWPD